VFPLLRLLKSLFGRSSPGTLILEGYWCESEIKLPTKVRTPLGGNITVVTVCVDIRYAVENGDIVVRGVQLSRSRLMGSGSALNIAAARTGEAWHAAYICPESMLKAVVEADLACEKSRLSRIMRGKWREANRGSLHKSFVEAINDHATPDEIRRLVSEVGSGVHIAFKYAKPDGNSTTRRVTVLGVTGASLRARDHKDDEVKSFRIDRISDVRAL
jgi:hypothetical protein